MRDLALPVSRRRFLALGASTLGVAYLAACGDGGGNGAPAATDAAPTATSPAATSTAAPDALRWRRLNGGDGWPLPRRDHSLVSDGERLYLFAGRNPDPMSDLSSYDLASGTWTALIPEGDQPPPRFGHNAVWDAQQGRMLVFGGQSFATFFDDLWAFDPGSGWTQLSAGPAPAARYGSGGALDGEGRLIVTHGFTTQGRFDDTWQYDGAWTDLSPAAVRPIERCLMRAVWDSTNQRLLMFGGQTTSNPFLGDTWAFDANGWRQIDADPGPSPRTFYAMVDDPSRSRMVLFGGNSADGALNDVWAFDHTGEGWAELTVAREAPTPRAGHDAVVVGDRLLAFGGTNPEGDSADLWELSLVP